jgi:hypothetical protein
MKKVKEMYGVKIVKPWSKEMYDHNELVAEEIRSEITKRWELAISDAEIEYDSYYDWNDEHHTPEGFELREWEDCASAEMKDIQNAITLYGFGSGYAILDIEEKIKSELENAAFFRLKEMAEDLELDLKAEIIGL